MFKLNSFRHEQTKTNISMTKQLRLCTLKSLAFIRMRVYVFMQNTQTTRYGLVMLQLATTLRYLRFVFSQTLNKKSACWSLAKPNYPKSLELRRIHVYYLFARTKERQLKRIYNKYQC